MLLFRKARSLARASLHGALTFALIIGLDCLCFDQRKVAWRKNVVYGFGTFSFDPARRVLDSAGESIGIPPKALDALIYLIEHGDRVVKKEELVDVAVARMLQCITSASPS